MSDNVAAESPQTEFLRPCNLCPHMKRINLENIRDALRDMKNEITIAPGSLVEHVKPLSVCSRFRSESPEILPTLTSTPQIIDLDGFLSAALAEDLGGMSDITSEATIAEIPSHNPLGSETGRLYHRLGHRTSLFRTRR